MHAIAIKVGFLLVLSSQIGNTAKSSSAISNGEPEEGNGVTSFIPDNSEAETAIDYKHAKPFPLPSVNTPVKDNQIHSPDSREEGGDSMSTGSTGDGK